MRKGIKKEYIVDAAVMLADSDTPMRSVGFRGIARLLGCAHTNLYNYYDSYESLLWAAQEEILHRLRSAIGERLAQAEGFFDALEAFFSATLDIYLAHPGWFYLAWHERFEPSEPQDCDAIAETVDALAEALIRVFERAGMKVDAQDMRTNLYCVHAYIHGELSVYLAGRGLNREEAAFRAHATRQGVRLLRLLTNGARL